MTPKNEYNDQQIYDEDSEEDDLDYITDNEFSKLVSCENGINNRISNAAERPSTKMSYTINKVVSSRRTNSKRFSKWAVLIAIILFLLMLYIPLLNDFHVPSRIGKCSFIM